MEIPSKEGSHSHPQRSSTIGAELVPATELLAMALQEQKATQENCQGGVAAAEKQERGRIRARFTPFFLNATGSTEHFLPSPHINRIS